MSSSVVRSAVMLTIYSFVTLLNRERLSVNTLALTAIIMLVSNPNSLFDIGFQLSLYLCMVNFIVLSTHL